jgi:uncharacterized protein (TIGR02265 family)
MSSESLRPAVRADFAPPPWGAPLDVNARFAAIPPGVTMKGLFLIPMVAEAKRRGITLKGARERYVPFSDYPLVEHARLIVEAGQAFFPQLSIRQALRKIGRASHAVLGETLVGKVLWSNADHVEAALESVAKSYGITASGSRVFIRERAPGRVMVRLEHVYHFLDSHHVGVFEAAVRACKVKGTIAIRLDSPCDGDFLITWDLPH